MSLKQPYEIIIADKLQQLPVPDMADAIWARIELELDAAADGDANAEATEPTGPVHPTAPGIATKTIAIVGGGLLALVVLFFILKKSTKPAQNKNLKPPTEQTNAQKLTPPPPTLTTDTAQYSQPIPLLKTAHKLTDSSALASEPFLRKIISSLLPLTVPEKDSIVSLNVAPGNRAAVDSTLLQTVPKRPRGIQIPDNQYKMRSSKRDSL